MLDQSIRLSSVTMIERIGLAMGRQRRELTAELQAVREEVAALREEVATLRKQKNTSIVHHGLWDATRAYDQGDAVSWHGSWWVCIGPAAAGAEPGTVPVWSLGAQRGGPGRKGERGPRGEGVTAHAG